MDFKVTSNAVSLNDEFLAMLAQLRTPRRVRGLIGPFLLLAAFVARPGVAHGQSTTDTLRETAISDRLHEAITAYQEEEYARVINRLLPVFDAAPVARSATEDGTAAYWLGRAYDSQSRSKMARRVWSVGVQQSLKKERLDVRSADAYIRTVYRDTIRTEYQQAASVYLLLLEKADETMTAERREIIQRHVSQMDFLLPSSVKREALQGEEESQKVDTSSRGGHRLASWWRSQDTKPATVENERVVEHLRRVAYAQARYGNERTLSGFDDRGRVYVRLGAPTATREINFSTGELLDVIHRIKESAGNNLSVSVSSFADNEFWLYESGEEDSPFLFVHDGNAFRIGGITDLIPDRYTSAMTGRTGRGGAKIDVVLEALRTAYRQLSTYHIGYGPGFNRLDEYLNKMEGARIRHEGQSGGMLYTAKGNRSDNSALIQTQGRQQPLEKSPSEMARSTYIAAKREDAEMARQREQHTPRQNTNTRDAVPRLPVATRVARFLEDDGTTSTRIYWGVSARDLEGKVESDSDPRLTNLSVRRMASDYRTRDFETKQYLVEPMTGASDITVADEQIQLEGDTSMYHLGLQWDQYAVKKTEAEGLKAGRQLRSGTARVDSLQPLTASPRQLEMSDLVPALHQSGSSATLPTRELEHPYPFTQINEAAPLAFYFEIYHLPKGENGKTRYTIQYEMHRRTDRGTVEQLFKGTEEPRTSVSKTRTGDRRSVKEYILLNLEDWELEADTELVVTVRVTDKQSGQEVDRSSEFRLVPSSKQ